MTLRCSRFRRVSVVFVYLVLLSFSVFSYDSHNISLLKSGKINYALAEWWINDEKGSYKTDSDTIALQSALSSGAEFVTITDIGRSWITEPLFLDSNTTVFFDRGVVIEAKKGSFYDKGDCLFKADEKENICLIGYKAVLKMHRADYTYPPYDEGQWRHVISLKSCSDIEIKGLSLRDSGGDGIYIGVSENSDLQYCRNILIEDIHVSGCYRQGISVISADNLMIINSVFEDTGNHLPSAGIDFEPNSSNEQISRCLISGCIFRRNFGPGILIFLGSLDKDSYPVSVKITDCKSYINRRPISIRKTSEGRRGIIILEKNIFIGFKGLDPATSSFQIIKK